MSERVRLFVVEDQMPVLRALTKVRSTFEDVELVDTASSGEEALATLPGSGARVALVDVELPGINGLELVGRLKTDHVACELLVLTSFAEEEKVFEAMRRGAAGYLVKGVAADRLHAAIHEVDRV